MERVKWRRLRSAPQPELAGLPAATKDLPWRTCVIDALMDLEAQVAIRKQLSRNLSNGSDMLFQSRKDFPALAV